jgi:hypothetical protein
MTLRASLLLASTVLVVLAAVLLAAGLVGGEGLGWFAASIGSSVVAAVALVGATRDGPAPGVATVAARSAGDDWLRGGDQWHDAPPVPAEVPVAPPVEFPIADYDDLTTDEVLGLLPQLYSDELDVVEARERDGAARLAILDRLAELRATGTDADRTVD